MSNQIKFIALDGTKEIVKFKNRNKKKTSNEFLLEYNLTQITWCVLRITETKLVTVNPGKTKMPSREISEFINTKSILEVLNSKDLIKTAH